MKNQLSVREKLFDVAKKLRFTGLDGNPINFDESYYVKGKLDLYNFRDIGEVRAFLTVSICYSRSFQIAKPNHFMH